MRPKASRFLPLLVPVLLFVAACGSAASPSGAGGGAPAPASGSSAGAGGKPTRLTLFTGPSPIYDAVWMAVQQGYFKAEGIDPVIRTFPSGTTALQTFKTGQGDIVFAGDLPAIEYWLNSHRDFRVIGIIERDVKGLAAIAQNGVNNARDLRGKIIGTRVGSTGSYFVSVYLSKNGLKPSDVTIKNLDPQTEVTAICNGDINAFFIWQPFPQRALDVCGSKVHYLTTAQGYVVNYTLAGARPQWLASHRQLAARFLKAVIRGAAYAKGHFNAVERFAKAKYGLTPSDTKLQWSIQDRVWAFDKQFYGDFRQESQWMVSSGLTKTPLDFKTFVDTRPLTRAGAKVTAPPSS
jgi:NitT/TauT family transport system substrate-binding protein